MTKSGTMRALRYSAAERQALLDRHERRLHVRLDLTVSMIDIIALDEDTSVWLATAPVQDAIFAVYASIHDARIAPDPPPGSKPFPPGIYGPTLLAAMVQKALLDAFPGENVSVCAAP